MSSKMKKNPSIRFNGFTDTWEQRKLVEELSLLKDGTHGTHIDTENGPYLLSAKNIKNGRVNITPADRKISIEEFNKIHTNFSLQAGDVLLTIVGSIGETAVLNNADNITFQRSVAYLRPKSMNSQFLYTTISGPLFQKELKNRQVVSAQPGIYLGDLAKIDITIPDIVEQTAIASFFKQLDDTIALHQRQLVNYKELKNDMQQKIFSQELRFKDEDGNDYSEWDIVSLGMVASVLNGYAFKSNEYNPDGKYKVLTISNVTGQRYANTSETNKMNTLPPNIQSHQLLEKGDILISLTGNVGRVSMVNDENCVLNQRVGLLKLESEKVNHEFIYQYLKNGLFEAKMIQSGQGAAQANISKGDLEEYAVLLPCKKEQQKISNFLYKLEEKIITIEIKILKLKELKKGFIQQMFV